eukprot:CAMPEP_0183504930 /NCGR_PEP_ID=MMETSP0371-20130417/6283_1 /TAXON_ID=268820 /ORGANISM="Peridinium aciculiferum, Strain PAER-2" /LENGTH=153 /DNA_ID=CAMNT_0025700465 /DNA_START=86 /DNA_END=547 /DNA_ORIENTATION=-
MANEFGGGPNGMGGQQPSTIGNVQLQVNEAVHAMKGNMQMMAERDLQLHDMASKTNDFVSSSSRFNRGATQLRRHQEWQRKKLCLIVAGAILAVCWAVAAYFLKVPLRVFLSIAAAALVAFGLLICVVERCCLREIPDGYQEKPVETDSTALD